jgi:hypothetical protein
MNSKNICSVFSFKIFCFVFFLNLPPASQSYGCLVLRNIETQTCDQPVQKFIKNSPKKTGHRIAITEKE